MQNRPGNPVQPAQKTRRRSTVGTPALAPDSVGQRFDFLKLAPLGEAFGGQITECVVCMAIG
jgi:hypothetical protein